MAQKTDLYSILSAYATRNASPSIDIDDFLSFLGKYANQHAPEHPEWQKWTKDVPVKFWAELSPLIEAKRCEIQNNPDGTGGAILLSSWYADLIEQCYRSIDETADSPFPDEKTIKQKIPPEYIRSVAVGGELVNYLQNPQETPLPVIRLTFPEEFGSALVLAPMIPRRLLETALIKVRSYFRSHGGRDYAIHKLPPQVADREIHLRDILNQIQTRPMDCIKGLEESEDFANLFWACFCSLIKNDVRREKDRGKEDVAGIQAAFLIEIFNGYYKSGVMKERERELAFKSLDSQFDKPPFLFTLDNIIRFTSVKGVLLLGQYSRDELETWLKHKSSESLNGGLPELLIITGMMGEKWFIKKKNILPLVAKLVTEAKVQVRKTVERRWFRILTAYRKEKAMENDRDFERLLSGYTAEFCPTLISFFDDAKLPALYREMDMAGTMPPNMPILYVDGELLSFRELYALKRKNLLADVKILLPFWYSIPILVAIIAFFSNLGREKPKRKDAEEENPEVGEENPVYDLRKAGRELEASIVPGDTSLEEYLEELEDRWSRLLDKEARRKLVDDVKSLVRDHFRYTLRNQKNIRLTREHMNTEAEAIIASNGTLKKLSEQKALHTYVVAYLTQLLLSVKF